MALETIGAALAIASTAVSVVSTFAQMGAANAQFAAQSAAAQRQAQAQIDEATRQQQQVNEDAASQKSERIRRADRELGTLRASMAERGVSGATFTGLVSQVAFFEGLDLSRIETNRARNIEAGEAAKRAAREGAITTIDIAENQRNVAITGAVFQGVGSGLQIGTSYVRDQQFLKAQENRSAA